MNNLYDDIARGCLENGKPIEAAWGVGSWTEQPPQQPEPEFEGGQCSHCGAEAWFFCGEFVECEACGKKAVHD